MAEAVDRTDNTRPGAWSSPVRCVERVSERIC